LPSGAEESPTTETSTTKAGGSQKALAAAIAWRDEQLVKINALYKREFHQIERSSNSGGAVGVLFSERGCNPEECGKRG
jgi:hypothetical protein